MTDSRNAKGVWGRVAAFLAVFCILASLAMVKEGRIFGHRLTAETAPEAVARTGGSLTVNTTEIGKSAIGYAGPVPVEIHVTEGRIDSVVPLPNSESPDFFRRLGEQGFFDTWKGKTLEEAASLQPDAVSGATYSSRAVAANVRAGAGYVLDHPHAAPADPWGWKSLAVLAVIACGAVLPLFIHNRSYRLVQQLLNVAVLGFWGGTFLDYAVMIGFFANGWQMTLASVTVVALLGVGLLYPLFGKGTHYCNWVCPLGSAQDLAGRAVRKKPVLSPRLVKTLDTLREALWTILLLLLYIGWGTSWIDHELFTAFVVESASTAVICVGVVFVALSVIVVRPFCRFVCPAGTLLKKA